MYITFMVLGAIAIAYHTPIFLYGASWSDLFSLSSSKIDMNSTNVIKFFDRVGYPITQDYHGFIQEKINLAILTAIAMVILVILLTITLIKINKYLDDRVSKKTQYSPDKQ